MSDRTPSVRFIILAVPRTGSNLLCTLLHSHPDILCHHELFNPRGIFYALDLRNTGYSIGGMSLDQRDVQSLEFLSRVWSAGEHHQAIGFKMTGRQHEVAFDSLLKDTSIRKIVLRRRDALATYVSRVIAEQCDVWEVYEGENHTLPKKKVYVDPQQLLLAIETNNAHYTVIDQMLRHTRQTALYVEYESLFERETHEKLNKFLDCQDIPLTAKSIRQNPEPIHELVENYEEVSQFLDTSNFYTTT